MRLAVSRQTSFRCSRKASVSGTIFRWAVLRLLERFFLPLFSALLDSDPLDPAPLDSVPFEPGLMESGFFDVSDADTPLFVSSTVANSMPFISSCRFHPPRQIYSSIGPATPSLNPFLFPTDSFLFTGADSSILWHTHIERRNKEIPSKNGLSTLDKLRFLRFVAFKSRLRRLKNELTAYSSSLARKRGQCPAQCRDRKNLRIQPLMIP